MSGRKPSPGPGRHSGVLVMPLPRASSALSRFTVLDLTRVRSGPTCVRQLADWGANVIKIETPPHLEKGEGPGGPRSNADFQNLHRNKRSITLDLKSPQGLAAFKKINKRIVLGSISGFGQDGPYRDRPGFDQIAQGMGGLMSITGLPGQGPVRVGIPIADLSAGLFCALGIMVALLEREVSGEGQWVNTSLLQAQIFMLDFQAARWLQMHEVAKQAGNNHPTSIPTGVFKTKDGHINIASTGQVMWERLCNALQAPELIKHPDYTTGALRSKNRDALNAEIDKRTEHKTSAEWIDIFNKIGVPCGPIYAIDEMFADEQVTHVGIAQAAKRPDGSEQVFVGQPVKLSRTPSKIVATPPAQGQHTDEVLKEFGFADNEIAELHNAQAV